MQYQYNLTPGFAGMLMGILVVLGGGFGTFLGGLITKTMKLRRDGVIKMWLSCQIITVISMSAFLLTCPMPDFIGLRDNDDSNQNSKLDLVQECNKDCTCSISHYKPVCGADNSIYYNPCFAGCLGSEKSNVIKNYTDCQCIGTDTVEKIASDSLDSCIPECGKLIYFLILFFIGIFFVFMSAMPSIVATLRAVEPVHRSLGLGIESLLIRLVGTIPGPVIFGLIIDSSCLLWQQQPCNKRCV